MRRHELTEEQWRVIEPLLPVSGAKGRSRVDDRRVINGMLYKAKTGWHGGTCRTLRAVQNGVQPVLAVVAQRHVGCSWRRYA
ncbi:transposase [Nocardia sp. NPDC019302]|uniref:transposase n=1 Tax=Nocardia sp. NPDC019302 TaxID=3154592 RepID=UPI0033E3B862